MMNASFQGKIQNFFMGCRLTFCAISALKENLHAPFPFLMRLWRNGAAQSLIVLAPDFMTKKFKKAAHADT
jgi:hypothetical protein